MKKFAALSAIAALLIVSFTFSSCSSAGSGFDAGYDSDAALRDTTQARTEEAGYAAAPAADMASPEMAAQSKAIGGANGVTDIAVAPVPPVSSEPGVAGPTTTPVVDSRKIIKNMDFQLQTQKFDEDVAKIPSIAEQFGGYVENSYVEGRDMYNERGQRHANFTLRVPQEKLDALANSLGSGFHVTSKSQYSQDITETYYDSKARLDSLKLQEQRLTEMLAQATELEYLLSVERELMNVRYQIESMTSQLNRMDNSVNYSTVTMYITEVVKLEDVKDTPVTFPEKIANAFSDSIKYFVDFIEGAVILIISFLPILIVVGLIILIVRAIVRRAKRNKPSKKDANIEAKQDKTDDTTPTEK